MFKPLQEVNFKLISSEGKPIFADATEGKTYRGIFLPDGNYTPTCGSMIDDAGGLIFVDDVGDICTLSTDDDAENIEIIQ